MKAVRYYGKEDLRIDEIAEPEVRPGTIKIAPAYTGICGSDVHLYFDGPMPPAPSQGAPHPVSGETLPVVMGHEFSGAVEEVGPGVTGINVGDHVVVEPFMVDGTCPSCNRGDYHLCDQMGFIGISGRGGGLAEHIVVEERWVHPAGSIPSTRPRSSSLLPWRTTASHMLDTPTPITKVSGHSSAARAPSACLLAQSSRHTG